MILKYRLNDFSSDSFTVRFPSVSVGRATLALMAEPSIVNLPDNVGIRPLVGSGLGYSPSPFSLSSLGATSVSVSCSGFEVEVGDFSEALGSVWLYIVLPP